METMAPIQIETVNGQVAHVINNHHQHCHTHHHQHQHHHTHIGGHAFALQAPPAPQARVRPPKRPAYDLSAAQKDLLALMRPLPKPARGQVLDFMRVEFGTGLVMDLDPSQLQRVRGYVQVILGKGK